MKNLKWLIAISFAVVVVAITTYVYAYEKNDMRVGNTLSNESVSVTLTDGNVTVVKTVSKTDTDGKFHISFNVSGGEEDVTETTPLNAVIIFDNSGSMICDSSKDSYAYTLSEAQDATSTINLSYWTRYSLDDLFQKYTAAKGDNESIYCSKFHIVNRRLSFIDGNVVLSSKWENAVEGAKTFTTEILAIPNSKISYVTFASSANTATAWYADENSIPSSVYGHPTGATNLYDALSKAYSKLNTVTDGNVKKVILVISDGEPTEPTSESNNNYPVDQAYQQANTIKGQNIKIFTIGYDIANNATARTILTNVSSTKSDDETQYAFLAGVDNVQNVFTNLATYLSHLYATNGVLTDKIGANFKFSDGTSGNTYTHTISRLTNEGETFGFDIIIDQDSSDGWYKTNNGFTLTYTDAFGNEGNKIESGVNDDPEVYWVANKYPYVINYYKDSNDNSTVENEGNFLGKVDGQDILNATITADTTKFIPQYYKFEGVAPSMNIGKENNVLNVIYVKDESQTKNVSYKVHHYVDGSLVANDDYEDSKSVWAGEVNPQIDVNYTVNPNKYTGYKLDSESSDTIPTKANANAEFNIYYVKDETQTKKLSYTVKYYKDNVEVTEDEYTTTKTVWINDETLKVDTIDTANDKYVGYTFDHTEPGALPTEVTDKTIIKVFYIKDDAQTKQLNYIIRHYKDTNHILADDYAKNITVWINDPDTIEVDYSINQNKYLGYKLDTENSSVIPAFANSGSGFDLYYVKDQTQTKELSYTVKYYKDNAEVTEDEYTITKTVWINDELIKVDAIDTADDKYVGYTFDHTNPDTIPTEVADKTLIKVYYVKDESQTKELSYTIKHFKDNTPVEKDDYISKKAVWINDPDTITVDYNIDENKYTGYVLDLDKTCEIPESVENKTVLNIYYKKGSYEYTINYFYDDVKDISKTEKFTALYADVISKYPDKNSEGYILEKVENLPLTISDKENVINVYYAVNGMGTVIPEPPHTAVSINHMPLLMLFVNSLVLSLLIKRKGN